MPTIQESGNLSADATSVFMRWETRNPAIARKISFLRQDLIRQIESDFAQSWSFLMGAGTAITSRPISPAAEIHFTRLKSGLDAPWTLLSQA